MPRTKVPTMATVTSVSSLTWLGSKLCIAARDRSGRDVFVDFDLPYGPDTTTADCVARMRALAVTLEHQASWLETVTKTGEMTLREFPTH